jgi:hypothetical protein
MFTLEAPQIDIKFKRFTFISNVHNSFEIHHNIFEIHYNIGLNLFSHTLHHWAHTDNGNHTPLVLTLQDDGTLLSCR